VDLAVVITNDPETASRLRPDSRILCLGAAPNHGQLRKLPNCSIGVLETPFEPERLLAEVARLLRKPAVAEAEVRHRDRPQPLPLKLTDRLRRRAAGLRRAMAEAYKRAAMI
jgi:hypothetical protein